MTQHVDEIAREIAAAMGGNPDDEIVVHYIDGIPKGLIRRSRYPGAARAAMRAVVKQMRERTTNTSVIIFLTAYERETGINE